MIELLKKIGSFVLDTIQTIVVALAIFVVVYLFLLQPNQVKGASMEPSFHDNEYILTDKVSYRLGNPKRGDVVVFKSPRNPEIDYIKRVIGLPGERVKIMGGFVLINDKKLNETYLPSTTVVFPGAFLSEGKELKIAPGEYFLMGDNRNHSSDSREWGPIPKSDIVGRSFFRYWPPAEFGFLPKTDY